MPKGSLHVQLTEERSRSERSLSATGRRERQREEQTGEAEGRLRDFTQDSGYFLC